MNAPLAPDPLAVNLSAQRPISDAPRQPLPVEMLLTDAQRRITVEDHKSFREEISTPQAVDPIDELASDTIHDHIPQAAPSRKVRGVLSILDKLDRENSNRRFNS